MARQGDFHCPPTSREGGQNRLFLPPHVAACRAEFPVMIGNHWKHWEISGNTAQHEKAALAGSLAIKPLIKFD
jgi:hypothetical protein